MIQWRLRTGDIHELALDGRRVLLHVPSTSLFDLDDVGHDVLAVLRQSGPATTGEVVRRLGARHPGDEVARAVEEFARLAVLDDAAAAPAQRRRPKLPDDALTTLVLGVTTGCNLGCTYCYKEDLSRPGGAATLSPQRARAAVDLLIRESGGRRRINLTFFGGEPLTNRGLIAETVAYAEERAAAVGKTVDFSLTTNGTLLDDDVVAFLDAHRFAVTVSMDGPAEIHDRNRLTVGGKGTYAVVAERARRLLAAYRSRPVGARVTVAAGGTDVEAIHRHLKDDIGFAEVGFAPVTAGLAAGHRLDSGETRAVFDGLTALARRYRDEALMGRDIGFSNMGQLMTALHEGTSKLVPCGAGVALLAVDTDGRLALCHRFVGAEAAGLPACGDVETGIDRRSVAAFVDRAVDRAERECGGCPARSLCAGGCYHEAYARFGDPLRRTEHYCDLMREWVDLGIGIYAEIMARNPGFLAHRLEPRRMTR